MSATTMVYGLLALVAVAGWVVLVIVFWALFYAEGERYDAEAQYIDVGADR